MKRITIILIMGVLLLYSLSGCAYLNDAISRISPENEYAEQTAQNEIVINPERQEVEMEVTLYFKHEFADFLVPSQRKIQKGRQTLEEIVVEEVLKGPAKFGRVDVMPPNVKMLDVIRKDDIVFVNLNEAFMGDVDIAVLPGKQNIPEERVPIVLAEMKRLAVYSIVNSLTELSGVQQVKILINNRPISYNEIGMDIITGEIESYTPDAMVMPIARDSRFVLSPAKVVEEVFANLVAPQDWARVYAFLADITVDGDEMPPIEEFKQEYTSYISEVAVSIRNEEIRHDGTAFVTVDFSVSYTNGRKYERNGYSLRLVNQDGIWRLKLPEFLN